MISQSSVESQWGHPASHKVGLRQSSLDLDPAVRNVGSTAVLCLLNTHSVSEDLKECLCLFFNRMRSSECLHLAEPSFLDHQMERTRLKRFNRLTKQKS